MTRFFRTFAASFGFTLLLVLTVGSCDDRPTQAEEEPLPSGTIFIPFDATPSKGTQLAGAPSPFGCTLATLQDEGAERSYRYQSFYIRFPDSILDQADTATRQVEFILNHKNVAGRVPLYKGNEGTVRVVNCRIPDAPRALDILYEEIQKFSDQSWVDDQKASQRNTGSGKPGGQTTSGWVQHCTLTLDYTIGNSEGEIYKYVYQITCQSYWVNEEDDDNGFGGDGGTWGSGDDGDACEPCQPGDICENTAPGIGCDPGGGGLDEDSIIEIIIDPSFSQNPCLSAVYDQAGQAPAYLNILKNFDEEFSVANLILSTGVEPGYEKRQRSYL